MMLSNSNSWYTELSSNFEKQYFIDLSKFVEQAYHTQTCYPLQKDIFAAFEYCNFKDVKVVIIGQDPYHGPNQANGLCFSVHKGMKHPPSLVNIFKELNSDLKMPIPTSGDLSLWAKQGVLLLNATLTVEAGKAGSHQKQGWETFTDAVIQTISDKKEGIVFLLWGGFAHKKGAKIDSKQHCVLHSGHPSPLSANRGYWFGNQHFSKTNEYLLKVGKRPIDWRLA